MSQRLKNVISRLYHPAVANGRQVLALSRREAERLPLLETIAVISITSPSKPFADLPEFDHLLRLQFEDVDFHKADLSRRAREKMVRAFTDAQAVLVLEFVEGLPASTNTIIVHCEGGYSRSTAIALGLHRLFGYQVEMERLAQANSSVLTTFIAAGQGSNRRPRK